MTVATTTATTGRYVVITYYGVDRARKDAFATVADAREHESRQRARGLRGAGVFRRRPDGSLTKVPASAPTFRD